MNAVEELCDTDVEEANNNVEAFVLSDYAINQALFAMVTYIQSLVYVKAVQHYLIDEGQCITWRW